LEFHRNIHGTLFKLGRVCIFDVNNKKKYGRYQGKFGDILVFQYANNSMIKKISIPSIVWVEENADSFSIIYIK
jgi:hypothetical protein